MPNEQLPFYYSWFPWWRDALEGAHFDALSIDTDYYVDEIKEKYGDLRLLLTNKGLADLDEDYDPRGAELDLVAGMAEARAEPIS